MATSKEEKDLKKLRALIEEYPENATDILLETPFWHPGIRVGQPYGRESDDTDGRKQGIAILFSEDGDAWCEVHSFDGKREEVPAILHRFRSYFGGSNSTRVRTGLMVLARAIGLDNKEKPDRP